VEFENGVNAEGVLLDIGHSMYGHMVSWLFEDCVDVVKILYCNDYDYILLFDHSCGHDRKRPDGICANSITKRKGFGGKQASRNERYQDRV
jgi:hypothetical protein